MARKGWEGTVEKVAVESASNGCMVVTADDAVTLLARQHADFVRIVKKLRDGNGHSSAAICQPAYQLACDDILAALGKRKGEKK